MSLARNYPILGMLYRLHRVRDSSCFADRDQRPELALRPYEPLFLCSIISSAYFFTYAYCLCSSSTGESCLTLEICIYDFYILRYVNIIKWTEKPLQDASVPLSRVQECIMPHRRSTRWAYSDDSFTRKDDGASISSNSSAAARTR